MERSKTNLANEIGRDHEAPPTAARSRLRGGARPFPVTPARRELIGIQKGIVERIQREIDDSVGGVPPVLRRYYDEYWRELRGYERVATREELYSSCAAADVVYCGDYHSLRASQRTASTLIRELSERRPGMVVAIEMVHSRHQDALDAFQDELIEEDELLQAIEYARTWDFHWPPYRDLLALCRERNLRVLGINVEPPGKSRLRILERDLHAAKRIADQLLAEPDRLVFVLDGDLHVSSDHLPLVVQCALAERGATRKHAVVHQNAEPIYWQLAERGLERTAQVVRVKEDCYCVFSATPLVKLQSYLSWQLDHRELHEYIDPVWHEADDDELDPPDYAEQVRELIRSIAGFLELDSPELDNFTVYTTSELDMLEALARDHRLTEAVLADLRAHVRAGRSYFVPHASIIYLADSSLFGAAEEATHFINTVFAGFDREPREPRDAFYYHVIREALGFFGSRVVDPRRTCTTERDMREWLAQAKGQRLEAPDRRTKRHYELVLRHLEAERIDQRPRPRGFRRHGPKRDPFPKLPVEDKNAVIHLLGYRLGDKLHAAMLAGVVRKPAVRHLFKDPLRPGYAEKLYLELSAYLTDVQHDSPAREERVIDEPAPAPLAQPEGP